MCAPCDTRMEHESTPYKFMDPLAAAQSREYTSRVSINDSRSILQTEDRKKWVALELLPQEWRSRLENGDERNSTEEDRAASRSIDKIKAWVRRTKEGCVVRILKKKTTAKRDTYMEYFIERDETLMEDKAPDSPDDLWQSTEYYELSGEKTMGAHKLSSNAVHEMVGSPGGSELEARYLSPTQQPSRPEISQSGHQSREESTVPDWPLQASWAIGTGGAVHHTLPTVPAGGSPRDHTARPASPPSYHSNSSRSRSFGNTRPSSQSKRDENSALTPEKKDSDRSPLGSIIATYLTHKVSKQESQSEDHDSDGGSPQMSVQEGFETARMTDREPGSALQDEPKLTSTTTADPYRSQQPEEVVPTSSSLTQEDDSAYSPKTIDLNQSQQSAEIAPVPSGLTKEEAHVSSLGEVVQPEPSLSKPSSPAGGAPNKTTGNQPTDNGKLEIVATESALQTIDEESGWQAADETPGTPDENFQPIPHDEQAKHEAEAIIKIAVQQLEPKQQLGKAKDEKPVSTELRGHRVSQVVGYETETDAEPPSPSDHEACRLPIRHKVGSRSKGQRKRPTAASKSKATDRRSVLQGSSDTSESSSSASERRTIMPRKLELNDNAEHFWTALLQGQRKLLGVEHELVYKAKLGRSQSRQQEYRNCSPEVLNALYESEKIAIQNLGAVHPEVKSFSANLKSLQSLVATEDTQEAGDLQNTVSPSPNTPYGEQASRIERTDEDDNGGRAASGNEDSAHGSATTSSPRQQIASNLPPQVRFDASATASPEDSRLIQFPPGFRPSQGDTLMSPTDPPARMNSSTIFNSERSPHEPRNDFVVLISLALEAMSRVALETLLWLRHTYGPEPEVKPGEVRVRWTCSCGQQLYDDFTELRQGAARELEAYLNRPRANAGSGHPPLTPSSSYNPTPFSSMGVPPSSQTSLGSVDYPHQAHLYGNSLRSPTLASLPEHRAFSSAIEESYLLTCANEDRFTPKVQHINVPRSKILDDRDLALELRKHYVHVNRQWWKCLKLRGLTKIEFIQFEKHKNRFADIRKCPDVPPVHIKDYTFERGQLLPPVGSTYLVHLFQHPEDYHQEDITYLRVPKKNSPLDQGVGWGISLYEGFASDRVIFFLMSAFGLASLVFAVAWVILKKDIQGAFSVAQWICTLAGLAFAWVQSQMG